MSQPAPSSPIFKVPLLLVSRHHSHIVQIPYCPDPLLKNSASYIKLIHSLNNNLTISSCSGRMEEQLKVLNKYFKPSAIQFLEDPNEKDKNLIEGEYWEFKDPEKVEAWGLMMIPNNNNLAFTYKFKNVQCFLNLSFLEKVKDVEPDAHPTIRVKCMTTIP